VQNKLKFLAIRNSLEDISSFLKDKEIIDLQGSSILLQLLNVMSMMFELDFHITAGFPSRKLRGWNYTLEPLYNNLHDS